LENVQEGKELPLNEAQEPGVVIQGAPAPKKFKTKAVKKPRAQAKAAADPVPVLEQEGENTPGKIDEDNEVPDPDTVYQAKCIVKQRQRKRGRRQFLVKWADETSEDSWCDEIDVSDALLAHWFIAQNQKGLKRKKLKVALINVSESWACRRGKEAGKEGVNPETVFEEEQ